MGFKRLREFLNRIRNRVLLLFYKQASACLQNLVANAFYVPTEKSSREATQPVFLAASRDEELAK